MVSVPELFAAALSTHQAGQLATARELYCRVLQADPTHAEAMHLVGVLAFQAGDAHLALACLEQVRPRQQTNATFHNNHGTTLRALGRLDEAASAYRAALRIQPDYVEAHANLGNILSELGQKEEAASAYEAALRLRPIGADAARLGRLREDQQRWTDAEAAYREAHRLDPNLSGPLNNLGNVLTQQGRLDEALDAFRAAVKLSPTDATAHNNLAGALLKRAHLREAITTYREAIRLDPHNAAAHSNLVFALVYDPMANPLEIFEEHLRWAEYHGQAPPPPPFPNLPDPERRLRVGYVSPDFRRHAVARFLEPIFASHDSAQVEAIGFADLPRPDAVTERLKGLAHGWHSIAGLSTEAVGHLIRSQEVDLLVDLTGHTANHRLAVFAQRAAPLQITYLGYPNTTGLSQMDYRLTEAVADPPGANAFYSERLVRLEGAFCCFAPPEEAPAISPLPALTNGYVTFGSPHNLAKLNDGVLALWARVLAAVPGSRLRLFRGGLTGALRDEVTQCLTRQGIARDRVELSELSTATAGYGGYLAALAESDIVLDAFPANAGTTACESLHMGVPLITLRGDRFYGRLSASLLTSVGLRDWVAESPEEYVALAIQKATDLSNLAELRQGLRQQMRRSPLGDGALFTRSLEQAYRGMWRRWCLERSSSLSRRAGGVSPLSEARSDLALHSGG